MAQELQSRERRGRVYYQRGLKDVVGGSNKKAKSGSLGLLVFSNISSPFVVQRR